VAALGFDRRGEDVARAIRVDGRRGFAFPEGVRLAAGPGLEEEAKIIRARHRDHAKTFQAFAMGIAYGSRPKRRLTPVGSGARSGIYCS
jgi:hypothetical protein